MSLPFVRHGNFAVQARTYDYTLIAVTIVVSGRLNDVPTVGGCRHRGGAR